MRLVLLILALAIGYDAVVNDGRTTKQVWQQARDLGSAGLDRIDREFDRAPSTTADRAETRTVERDRLAP